MRESGIADESAVGVIFTPKLSNSFEKISNRGQKTRTIKDLRELIKRRELIWGDDLVEKRSLELSVELAARRY